MKYDIDFKSLIPPISDEERVLLTKSILKDGCRDNIVVWTETLRNGEKGRTMILDGHNRYEICKKHKIKFAITELKLKSMEEAKMWVIQNQLGRRNLTDYQRAKLTLQLKTMIAKKAKAKQSEAGQLRQKSDKAKVDTKKELAKISGVSHDTIHKVEVIEKEAPAEVKMAAEKGKISINKAYQKTKEATQHERSLTMPLPPSGMRFARLAIHYLGRITEDDVERDQALAFVKQWIEEHERR